MNSYANILIRDICRINNVCGLFPLHFKNEIIKSPYQTNWIIPSWLTTGVKNHRKNIATETQKISNWDSFPPPLLLGIIFWVVEGEYDMNYSVSHSMMLKVLTNDRKASVQNITDLSRVLFSYKSRYFINPSIDFAPLSS